MTTYGTIPTSSSNAGPLSPNLEFVSRPKDRIKEGLGNRRPWKLMFNFRTIGLPGNFFEAITRSRTNLAYFRMNYAIIVLIVVFLSLLWHPISLIVLAAMVAAWLFLYFLRDEPLVVFNRTIDDRVVLFVLSVLTIVFLLLTVATVNILVALLIGAAVVLVHAAFRRTDDLFLDEEAAGLMRGASPTPPSTSS